MLESTAGGTLKAGPRQEEPYSHGGESFCVILLADASFPALLDDLLTGKLGGCLWLRGPGGGNLVREKTMDQSHDVGLGGGIGDLGDHALTDPDVGTAGWIGEHQDGVREHLGGLYYGLVNGETNEAGLLLGELEFGWFGDDVAGDWSTLWGSVGLEWGA